VREKRGQWPLVVQGHIARHWALAPPPKTNANCAGSRRGNENQQHLINVAVTTLLLLLLFQTKIETPVLRHKLFKKCNQSG
jgi:hypothetical protein